MNDETGIGAAHLVAIGECMIEPTSAGDRWTLGYAGDTYNTASYLARLGLRVAYMTATGTDPFSNAMRAA